MDWIAEFWVEGPLDAPREVAARALGTPGLLALDAYTPARDRGDDPLNPAEAPPALVMLLGFATEATLRAALAHPDLANLGTDAPAGAAMTFSAFRRHPYPVPGGPGWPLAAPVSYLVRYELPADDPAAFQRAYMDSHPPVQARLPGIRSILCDVPLPGLSVPGIPDAGWLIGNEVAFDDAAAFAAAMRSPARAELRAHMAGFPAFSGITHHHLMDRERMLP